MFHGTDYLSGQPGENMVPQIEALYGQYCFRYLVEGDTPQAFWQDAVVWVGDFIWEIQPGFAGHISLDDPTRYAAMQSAKWGIQAAQADGANLQECLLSFPLGGLSGNPNTPAQWLDILSRHSCEDVRRDIASNPSTPPHCMRKLARDVYEDVRCAVALNPVTSPSILHNLAGQEKTARMFFAIVGNPNSPAEALEVIADRAEDIFSRRHARRELACRANTIPVHQLALWSVS